MCPVHFLHESDELHSAELDKFLHRRFYIFVLCANKLVLGHTSFLQNAIKGLTLAFGVSCAVQNAKKDERVSKDLSILVLENIGGDELRDPRVVLVNFSPS